MFWFILNNDFKTVIYIFTMARHVFHPNTNKQCWCKVFQEKYVSSGNMFLLINIITNKQKSWVTPWAWLMGNNCSTLLKHVENRWKYSTEEALKYLVWPPIFFSTAWILLNESSVQTMSKEKRRKFFRKPAGLLPKRTCKTMISPALWKQNMKKRGMTQERLPETIWKMS